MKLKLGMVFAGEVACTFRDGAVVEVLDTVALDSYWDEESSCECIGCGWKGRVGELTAAGKDPGGARCADRLPEVNLAEIEREVLSGACPAPIRHDVRTLIQTIRQLQKQVQILETISRAQARGRLVKSGETAVL